jgi:hypothetical protein
LFISPVPDNCPVPIPKEGDDAAVVPKFPPVRRNEGAAAVEVEEVEEVAPLSGIVVRFTTGFPDEFVAKSERDNFRPPES